MITPLAKAVPDYDFRSEHSRKISAPPSVVWQALTTVTLAQLRLARPLLLLRHVGREPAQARRPLLIEGPIPVLAKREPAYALAGTVGRPWQLRPAERTFASLDEMIAFSEPGWVKSYIDFEVLADGKGSLLRTETRVHATSASARRRFALYWGLIRLGSGLVRRDILNTIAAISTRA